MPGRNSKKSQNNFEKIKREMNRKKQKADGLKNDFDLKAELEERNMVEGVPKDEERDSAKDKKIEMVVFRVGEEEFAFILSNVKEIIRVPAMMKVPNTPPYIAGLCSLRGELLPVIDSHKLFGIPDKEYNESSRIIVTDMNGKKVGMISDKVSEVLSTEEIYIKETPESIREINGGVISGILVLDNGKRIIMILDAEKIVKAGELDSHANYQNGLLKMELEGSNTKIEEEQIIIFAVGNEEYAVNINDVKEIIRLPSIMKVPNTANYIEGVLSIRNHLLAAINLGKLLNVNCKEPDEYSRVIIIDTGSFTYGVIVDRVLEVAHIKKDSFKKHFQIAISKGTEFIKGFVNLNNGRRLVMVLETNKIVNFNDLTGICDGGRKEDVKDNSVELDLNDYSIEHIVIFKIANEEYGIRINYVQEINRMSELVRFPGAPAFIEGMVDLRGEVIPILNLRTLFAITDIHSLDSSKFLVIEYQKKKIGILIDSVSEILRFSNELLEEAPEVISVSDKNRYIDSIAKLSDGKRVILILNLAVVLNFM
ncbi:MAG: chemotaxis protein CheW [Firmicutes bacterium]|nr:chemotaxis protein CheW [Bacillota bacterium]